jgi:diguanylate cyclase (GGDEF)-like protein
MKTVASMDGLTGVLNKRFVTQRLAEQAHRCVEDRQSLAVFLLDIDHFKHYNDRNGHVAGDALLRKLAQLVQGHVRQEDFLGRFGGEEFLLVLPGASKRRGLAAAEKVRRLIAEHAFDFGAEQPLGCVSISGGVAACPEDATESVLLLRSADEALYAAKNAGRNRVLGHVARHFGGKALEPVEPPDYQVTGGLGTPGLASPGEAASPVALATDCR